MVGSVTLLLKAETLQRILLPLVAFAAGSLIGGAFFHMIPAGLDALVFTAGIGEHSTEIRKRVCTLVIWLDFEIDDDANQRHDLCISTKDSAVSVWVIPTNEEGMIAQHTCRLLDGEA